MLFQSTAAAPSVMPPLILGATPSIVGAPTPIVDSTQQSNPTLNAAYTSSNPVLILVGVKQGLANGPDPQTLVVTESGNVLTQRGATDPGQVRGNVPSWYAYYVQAPGGTGIVATISGTANPTDAMTIIPIELQDATGLGTITPITDDSAPATTGAVGGTTTQDRSRAVAIFGVRGSNTPVNFFAPAGAWTESFESETGAADFDDFSFQLQALAIETQGSDTATATWTEPGRWSGLFIEVLGTPGDSLPVANDDSIDITTGGMQDSFNVLMDDSGGGLALDAVTHVSGPDIVDGFVAAGDVTYTPPAVAGVSVYIIDISNSVGPAQSTLTITTTTEDGNDFPSFADSPSTNASALVAFLLDN